MLCSSFSLLIEPPFDRQDALEECNADTTSLGTADVGGSYGVRIFRVEYDLKTPVFGFCWIDRSFTLLTESE